MAMTHTATRRALCIDLFCGLGSGQSKLGRCEYSAIKQLVAGRAENPDHVRLSVFHLPPNSVSAVFRFMRQLYNSILAACLAGSRQIWKFAAKPGNHSRVLEWPVFVVRILGGRVLAMKRTALFLCRLTRTFLGTIAAIAGREDDVKMLPTYPAVPPGAGDIGLLVTPQASHAGLAFERTVAFIGPLRTELSPARTAEQIIRHDLRLA